MKMTPERIQIVIRKLHEIAETSFSDYAGFHMENESGRGYKHCFIVNNQPCHSSNLTLKLEEFSDAVKIISGFRRQSEQETLKELQDDVQVEPYLEIYLHYLKLQINCE